MKASYKLLITSVFAACALPVTGQVTGLPSRQTAPSENNSDVVPDGISFYHGQTFLLLNGRAARISSTLVPEGTVLTRSGRLVPMPLALTGRMAALTYVAPNAATNAAQDGIVHVRGQSYVVKGTSLVPIDARMIPEGQVLNASNTLSPLPSDFSGFNLERTPNGLSTLPLRSDNNQALSRQAGVPQIMAKATPIPSLAASPPSQVVSTGIRKDGEASPRSTAMGTANLSRSAAQRTYVPMTIQNAPPTTPAANIPAQMPIRTDYRGESSNPLLPLPPLGADISPDLPPGTGSE